MHNVSSSQVEHWAGRGKKIRLIWSNPIKLEQHILSILWFDGIPSQTLEAKVKRKEFSYLQVS